MIACRTASIVAFGGLYTAFALAACRESAVPASAPLGPIVDSGAVTTAAIEPLPVISLIDHAVTIPESICGTLYLVAVKGRLQVGRDVVSPGDVLVIAHSEPVIVMVSGPG